jgi:hypothetical protein
MLISSPFIYQTIFNHWSSRRSFPPALLRDNHPSIHPSGYPSSQPTNHLVNQPPVCPRTQASVPKPIYLSVKARTRPCISPSIEQHFLCFVLDAFFAFCGCYKSLSCIPLKKRSMGCNSCSFSFVSE